MEKKKNRVKSKTHVREDNGIMAFPHKLAESIETSESERVRMNEFLIWSYLSFHSPVISRDIKIS